LEAQHKLALGQRKILEMTVLSYAGYAKEAA
jgi:hypothetical protein